MQHHAYIYDGPLALLPALAADARERFGFSGEHDPDVSAASFERFGIEESRALVERAALRSISGRALFVIGISSITSEAQQALLKLLEEPQAGVTFVLLAPHGAFLLTVRSRALEYPRDLRQHPSQKVLGSASPQPDRFAPDAAAFMAASGRKRSETVVALLKDEEGAKERVREFLLALEIHCVKLNFTQTAEGRQGLEDIARIRSYLADRSPSLKMLLEHLAATLPTV